MASVANCDTALILEALRTKNLRVDGRESRDFRNLFFEFSPDSSSCLLCLGQTRVLSTVNAELGPPKQGRDNQGTISFKVGFDQNLLQENGLLGGVKQQTVMLTRLLERLFFVGNALDREALCIIAGKAVWNLQVDVRILDNDGNLSDACVLSVLGALSVHRRPEVTSEEIQAEGQTVLQKHSIQEREPLGLTLHHLPIPTTVAFFENGDLWTVDPDSKESVAMTGCITIVSDSQGNILNIQKVYGVPVSPSKIFLCTRVAQEKAGHLSKVLQSAIKSHEEQRTKFRIIRSDDKVLLSRNSGNEYSTFAVERQTVIDP